MDKETTSLEKVSIGAGIVFIGIFISKILGYGYRAILARMGIEEYGLLNIGFAIYNFLIILAAFGLNEGIIRYISLYKSKDEPAKIKGILFYSFKITLFLSILISALLFIFSDWLSKYFVDVETTRLQLSFILKVFAITIPFGVVGGIISNSFKAFQEVKYLVYVKNIGENLIKILLTLIILIFVKNILGVSIAFSITMVLTFILSFYFLNKKIFNLFNKDLAPLFSNKELITYSWPLLISGLTIVAISWTDTLMLGVLKGPFEVGIYNSAYPLAYLVSFFPIILTTLFLPIAIGLINQKKELEFKTLYTTITKWIFITNLVLILIFILFSKELISLLFGSEYINTGILVLGKTYPLSSLALIILSIGYGIAYIVTTCHQTLLVKEKTKTILYITLSALIINILLNYLFIPRYGVMGAAIATSFTFILEAILWYSMAYLATKIHPFSVNYVKILFNGIFALIVGFILKFLFQDYIRFVFIFISLVVVFIYLFLLLMTRSINRGDLTIFRIIRDKTNLKINFIEDFISRFI